MTSKYKRLRINSNSMTKFVLLYIHVTEKQLARSSFTAGREILL
jgi:hypothetical protein